MPNRFVTVASFDTAVEAWIFHNRLADAGLNPFVVDEHTVNTYWLYANAIGGVKVQIPASELEAFQQIPNVEAEAAFPEFEEDTPEEIEKCPDCASIEVQIVKWPKRLALWSLLIVNIPLPFYSRKEKCLECGFEKRTRLSTEMLKTPHFYVTLFTLAMLIGAILCIEFL